MAGVCCTLEVSVSCVSKQWKGFMRQSCYDYVRAPVVIVVAKIRAHARDRLAIFPEGNSGREALLFERPVPAVVKKKIGHVVIGDENVGVAILIVIGEGQAHASAGEGGNAGLV